MMDLDAELADGFATLRKAMAFLDDQFVVDKCRKGEPADNCLSCQSIAINDRIKQLLETAGELTASHAPAP